MFMIHNNNTIQLFIISRILYIKQFFNIIINIIRISYESKNNKIII